MKYLKCLAGKMGRQFYNCKNPIALFLGYFFWENKCSSVNVHPSQMSPVIISNAQIWL